MLNLWAGILLLALYLAVLAIYRLYFSPLATIPGYKLAALTPWYNAYHDLVRGGQYVWVVEEMHRKFGPIVRTRPDAVHIDDPAFIEDLYPQNPKRRREKFHTGVKLLMTPGSISGTADHDLHRRRRAVLDRYFSQQSVRRLEPTINDTLATLLERLKGWAKEGRPVHMNVVFRAAAKDIIQKYALGGGQSCLEMEDCNASFFDVLEPHRVTHLGTHMPWLAKILKSIPPALMTILVPRIGVFEQFMKDLADTIEAIRNSKEMPEGRTIFHEIIRSDNIPETEKETQRITEEAMVILFAGTDTTASTLAAIMYHMLADCNALTRLKAELEAVMPDPQQLPEASKLDKLPYLNAIIHEALRLYPGATHRQERAAPDEDLVYKDAKSGRTFVIPAGMGFGMAAPIVNRNPAIYRRPNEFLPDRYIENPQLARYLISFSKGARQCLGMHLAYQEMQMLIAGIFRQYDVYDISKPAQLGPTLELYETDERDICMDADYVTPAPFVGSKGLRVVIRQ